MRFFLCFCCFYLLSLPAIAEPLAGEIRVDGRSVASLEQAATEARAGSLIEIGAGVYPQAAVINSDGVVIEGYRKAVLDGVAAKGKAALVLRGDGATIRGLECRRIQVSSHNGACIRLEGRDLVLENVYFHSSEQGVLTGAQPGKVIIRKSLFINLGAVGRAHGIYIGGGELVIEDSMFLASKGEGHEIKTGAKRTLIVDSILASLDGIDSRLVDAYAGGDLVIEGSVLQEGPSSSNSNLIGIALEKNRLYPPPHKLTVKNSLVFIDAPRYQLVQSNDSVIVDFEDNLLVGTNIRDEGEGWQRVSRAALGLPEGQGVPRPILESWRQRSGMELPDALR